MIRKMFQYTTLLLAILWLLTPQVSIGQDALDLVAFWLFDEGKGAIAKDYSGNGHDGTIEGAQWAGGKFEGGLQFNGTSDKVTVPFANELALEQFTIEVWTKLQDTGYFQNIFGRGYDPQRNYELGIWLKGGTVFCNFTTNKGGTWGGARGQTLVTDDKWHHIAAAYDGKAIRIYVDGVLDGEKAVAGPPDVDVVQPRIAIGWTIDSPAPKTEWLKGTLDELALWRVPLSEAEIQKTMKEGLRTFYAVTPQGKLATLWGTIKRGGTE